MGLFKLILHPADPEQIPADIPVLLNTLKGIRFIGADFQVNGEVRHFAGEDFLNLITFLGCSPSVAFDPPQGGDGIVTREQMTTFCHIGISGISKEIIFTAGDNATTPRCPHCRYPVDDWQNIIATWRADRAAYRWSCPRCARDIAAPEFNCRQTAGFGRFFVDVWGIYPSEAVPTERLLRTLEETTGGKWRFFYYQR
ncbi:MAG: hypothetical protein GY731_08560 [Gammaproteobacteria bacterium]|nr:hypothetical protein [Gammaproteobacteria bacterium]